MRRKIATLDLEIDENSSTMDSIIERLDDGNDFPGFELERVDEETYELYSVE